MSDQRSRSQEWSWNLQIKDQYGDLGARSDHFKRFLTIQILIAVIFFKFEKNWIIQSKTRAAYAFSCGEADNSNGDKFIFFYESSIEGQNNQNKHVDKCSLGHEFKIWGQISPPRLFEGHSGLKPCLLCWSLIDGSS